MEKMCALLHFLEAHMPPICSFFFFFRELDTDDYNAQSLEREEIWVTPSIAKWRRASQQLHQVWTISRVRNKIFIAFKPYVFSFYVFICTSN